jgi:hypothetical protein
MEVEVPKRHVLRPPLSIDTVQRVCSGRGKKGALVEKDRRTWQRKVVIIISNDFYFFLGGGREDEDKSKQENGFQNFPF